MGFSVLLWFGLLACQYMSLVVLSFFLIQVNCLEILYGVLKFWGRTNEAKLSSSFLYLGFLDPVRRKCWHLNLHYTKNY